MTTESFEIHGGSQDGRVFEFVIPFRPLTFSMDGHERYCLNPDNASFGLVAPDADLVIHKDERDARFGSLDVPDDGTVDSTDAFCGGFEAKSTADHIATLEAENAKLRAESREFRGMDASVGIANPCPLCGQAKLFVGTGGHLTCSGSKCRNPCAIGDLPAENAKLKAERDAHESLACDADDALKESESENAKLRDLLRRVRGCFRNGETPATIAIELSTLMPEIKAAIEPAGEATS